MVVLASKLYFSKLINHLWDMKMHIFKLKKGAEHNTCTIARTIKKIISYYSFSLLKGPLMNLLQWAQLRGKAPAHRPDDPDSCCGRHVKLLVPMLSGREDVKVLILTWHLSPSITGHNATVRQVLLQWS